MLLNDPLPLQAPTPAPGGSQAPTALVQQARLTGPGWAQVEVKGQELQYSRYDFSRYGLGLVVLEVRVRFRVRVGRGMRIKAGESHGCCSWGYVECSGVIPGVMLNAQMLYLGLC